MQLEEYLRENELTVAEMAREIGVHYYQLYHVIRGGEPPLKTAMKIIDYTLGEVDLEDLVKRNA